MNKYSLNYTNLFSFIESVILIIFKYALELDLIYEYFFSRYTNFQSKKDNALSDRILSYPIKKRRKFSSKI